MLNLNEGIDNFVTVNSLAKVVASEKKISFSAAYFLAMQQLKIKGIKVAHLCNQKIFGKENSQYKIFNADKFDEVLKAVKKLNAQKELDDYKLKRRATIEAQKQARREAKLEFLRGLKGIKFEIVDDKVIIIPKNRGQFTIYLSRSLEAIKKYVLTRLEPTTAKAVAKAELPVENKEKFADKYFRQTGKELTVEDFIDKYIRHTGIEDPYLDHKLILEHLAPVYEKIQKQGVSKKLSKKTKEQIREGLTYILENDIEIINNLIEKDNIDGMDALIVLGYIFSERRGEKVRFKFEEWFSYINKLNYADIENFNF